MFYSNPYIIFAVLLLILATAWYVSDLMRATSIVRSALREAYAVVSPLDNQLGLASQFETVSEKLKAIDLIGPRWSEFSAQLLLPTEAGVAIQTPIQPEIFIHTDDLLTSTGVNLRFHAALPNFLVGAGLLFTFIGITWALANAAQIALPSATASARQIGLSDLLKSASFKFVTSICGLGLSIAYAVFRQRCLLSVDRAIGQFNSKLNRLIPTISSATLQALTNRLLVSQNERLEAFSTELAVNIGRHIDSTFDTRLGEHIGPLTGSMQDLAKNVADLAQNLSKGTDDALEKLVNKFIESLQGHAGNGMDEVANKLAGLATSLETLQQGLNEAALMMTQSAEKMTTSMQDGTDATLKRMTDQMTSLIDNLRLLAEQTKAAGDHAGRELADRIKDACGGFETMAKNVSTTLREAIEKMQTDMGKSAVDSAEGLHDQLANMVEALSELADASRKSGETAFNEMVGRLSTAATAFEDAATKVATSLEVAGENSTETFGRSAQDAVERIALATEGMRSQLDAMLKELSGNIKDAGQSISNDLTSSGQVAGESISGAGELLRARLDEFASGLGNAGKIAALALEEGGAKARGHMESGGSAVGDQARGIAGQIAGLGASAERLQGAVNGFASAASGASAPLQAAAQDLMAASSLAQETLRPLQAVGTQIRDGLEQLHGAVTHLKAAHEASKDLAASMDRSSERFGGVDKDLAETLRVLTKWMETFNEQVSKTVDATDKNLAKAATSLDSSIKSLNDTLEDFTDSLRTLTSNAQSRKN